MNPPRVCTRCVMDATAADISFDEKGVCNYCREYLERCAAVLFEDEDHRTARRRAFIDQVKRRGRGRRYDCVMGVSGGVDSTYAVYLAVREGLRPLAVHMDNGWNSELAQHNIENALKRLGVDLVTHVVDWNEYRGLMEAFFRADVIDVELLYDNALLGVNYREAARHGVGHILAGYNASTEGMNIPRNWSWFKRDRRNILAIRKAHNPGCPMKSFPAFGVWDYLYYEYVRRIRWIPFLDYYPYNKAAAIDVLVKECGYRPYLYKHYESVFTRFYQGYLLPAKFGVDKRKVHLSTLIASGQLSRAEALESMSRSPYPGPEDLEKDRLYFLKKMGWTEAMLDDYLRRPERGHAAFGSELPLWNAIVRWRNRFRWRRWKKRLFPRRGQNVNPPSSGRT